jgi:hypothetical protein
MMVQLIPVLLACLQFQTPAPHGRAAGKSVSSGELLATFIGIVRTNHAKLIRIEDVDKKILEFHATHKTDYYDDDRKIKASEIKPGEQVSIDAKQFPDGELEAVTVNVVRGTKKPASSGP